MSRKQKSFGDCKAEGSVWITLTTGVYHPDILVSACGLYKPVLVMFSEILKRSVDLTALSELAKAVDPAIKAASLAVLAKMIS